MAEQPHDPTPEPDSLDHERHASWAELFFDLVAVAGVGSLAHLLHVRLDATSLALYAILFLAFWLVWTAFMLYGNVAGAGTHVIRLLIGMFGLGVMAASITGVADAVLEEGGSGRALNVFAITYVATRLYSAQSWRHGEVLIDFPVAQHTVGVLPWVVSLWVDSPWKVALWGLGVALDLLLVLAVSGDDVLERSRARFDQAVERRGLPPQGRGGRGRGDEGRGRSGGRRGQLLQVVPVTTDPAHLAERLGLFVIIVLGEGVVQVVDAASTAQVEEGLLLTGLTAFVLLCGLFGLSVLYGFGGVAHLRADSVSARVGLGLHCLTTGTVATIAVGLSAAVEHGPEPLEVAQRWLLCGGVSAYFVIAVLAVLLTRERRDTAVLAWLVAAAVVPVLLAVVGGDLAARLVVAVLAAVVLLHVALEWRRGREGRAWSPGSPVSPVSADGGSLG